MSYEIDWDDDDINDPNDLVSELNAENTVATPNSFAGWSEISSKLEKEKVCLQLKVQ